MRSEGFFFYLVDMPNIHEEERQYLRNAISNSKASKLAYNQKGFYHQEWDRDSRRHENVTDMRTDTAGFP